MLSLIHKNDVQKIINRYPELVEFGEEIFLEEDKTKEYYVLPRYFKTNYNESYVHEFNDKTFNPIGIEVEFNSTLRPEQISLMEVINNIYSKKGYVNGIIKAKPGFGKTVCAAYITATYKKKTLIVLDNSKLVDQWVDAYLKFTTLTENDIGFIIGKKFDPKPVTITMVQTLVSKSKTELSEYYTKIKKEGFDLIFFDEMHKTTSTTKFGKASLFLNSKNIIGLTATPYGDDQHKFFMKNIIGDIIFDYSNYDEKPEVYFVKYKSGLKKYASKMIYIRDYIRRSGFYNKVLPESKTYFQVIYKLAEKLSKTNRKTIIIVFTVDQMKAIVSHLRENGIPAVELYSKQQKIDKINDKFIVATYKLASHGFDHAELSCLILATPLKGKTSLIQTIGRILRKKENVNKPLVFDLIDCEMGNIFVDTIQNKKNIISKEFNVTEFKEIDVS